MTKNQYKKRKCSNTLNDANCIEMVTIKKEENVVTDNIYLDHLSASSCDEEYEEVSTPSTARSTIRNKNKEKTKDEINDLKNTIKDTKERDSEIDDFIFNLYGLLDSEEEREVKKRMFVEEDSSLNQCSIY